jgi:hypothetical protein
MKKLDPTQALPWYTGYVVATDANKHVDITNKSRLKDFKRAKYMYF